jgi:hypothetical protein
VLRIAWPTSVDVTEPIRHFVGSIPQIYDNYPWPELELLGSTSSRCDAFWLSVGNIPLAIAGFQDHLAALNGPLVVFSTCDAAGHKHGSNLCLVLSPMD